MPSQNSRLSINRDSGIIADLREDMLMPEAFFDSAFQRRLTIAELIERGITDGSVLSQLIVNGVGISDEAVLWDFKRDIPVPRVGVKLNDATKSSYDTKFARVVKHCVAFYNTYGGYIIAGVDDTTRSLVGFSGAFNAADVNRRIQAATQISIETIYRIVSFAEGVPQPIQLGILFVPKRPAGSKPAAFKIDAPAEANGKRAYHEHDFYFRERDNSRPAKTPEDFEFLYSQRLLDVPYRRKKFIENNLPPRDEELKHLIGREKETSALWCWLPDAFSPVKILCGLGGVGKTSIVYTFAERLLYQAPEYIDKLLWLGAKTQTYLALTGKLMETRLDFETIDELLTCIILEAGCPHEQLPEKPSREQLMTLAMEHLRSHNYILIIDNVDTLGDDDQKKILSLVTQLCSVAKAKAILTARRNLGAAIDMFEEVEGLLYADFQSLISEKCKPLKLRPPIENSADMKSFYDASGGSPLFALSILRLVSLGDTFDEAVKHWAGAEGEHVRDIAFQRELKRLKANAAKVLLALCYLERAAVVELATVLGLTHADVQRALAELAEFSMTAKDTSLPGGATFKVPSMMGLITPLVEKDVTDWDVIKAKCQKFKRLSERKAPFIGGAITRTMAFLSSGDRQQALRTAKAALEEIPDDPDLLCLIGKVYSNIGDVAKADESFQAAYRKGSKKRVLLEEWASLREKREDWSGVIEIAKIGEELFDTARFVISKCNAEMMIGDQSSRIGRHREAEKVYERAIKQIHQALREYDFPGDRADLWKLNRALVMRWLGAVRMLTPTLDGNKRFFGACFKAIKTYRLLSKDVMFSGVAALRQWAQAYRGHGEVSERVYAAADDNQQKLKDLCQFINSRAEFNAIIPPELEQIESLIQELERICLRRGMAKV
jgi:tetratricopeptide (TPR) repeat protein